MSDSKREAVLVFVCLVEVGGSNPSGPTILKGALMH